MCLNGACLGEARHEAVDGLIQLAFFPGPAVGVVGDGHGCVRRSRHERCQSRVFAFIAPDLALLGQPEQTGVRNAVDVTP